MSMYDEPDECPRCSLTIEDLSNKIYQLELLIEEMEETHSDEVDYLHSEIDKLESKLLEKEEPINWKGVF